MECVFLFFFSLPFLFITENRYKHEAMVDAEPVLFEILDTCPKVSRYFRVGVNFFLNFPFCVKTINYRLSCVIPVHCVDRTLILTFSILFFVLGDVWVRARVLSDGGQRDYKHRA